MCQCVDTWQAYTTARRALDHTIGERAFEFDELKQRYLKSWDRYSVARDACDNPGQHPHIAPSK